MYHMFSFLCEALKDYTDSGVPQNFKQIIQDSGVPHKNRVSRVYGKGIGMANCLV